MSINDCDKATFSGGLVVFNEKSQPMKQEFVYKSKRFEARTR